MVDRSGGSAQQNPFVSRIAMIVYQGESCLPCRLCNLTAR